MSSAGCSRVGVNPPDGGGQDLAVAPEPLSADEQAAAGEGGEGIPALQQVTVLADTLFDFDPTLMPSASDTQNAASIEAHVGADGGTSCVSVSRFGTNGTILNVVFGPPPGCTLPSGATVSGSLSVAVSKAASVLSVAIGFQSIVVNGKTLGGTATFDTTNGSSFSVDADVTAGTAMVTATDLTVTGGTGKTTIDGTASISKDAGFKTALTFTGVAWNKGECYPSAGTLKVKKGATTVTMTFAASTATSGQVSVTVAGKTGTAVLPSYGACGA